MHISTPSTFWYQYIDDLSLQDIYRLSIHYITLCTKFYVHSCRNEYCKKEILLGSLFWQGVSTISLIVHALCTLMPCNFRILYCRSYRTSYRSYMYVTFAYRIAGGARTCLGVNPFRHSHIPPGEHKAFAKITLNSLLYLFVHQIL